MAMKCECTDFMCNLPPHKVPDPKVNDIERVSEWRGSPFRFPIQAIQFLAPVQFEAFPIYI